MDNFFIFPELDSFFEEVNPRRLGDPKEAKMSVKTNVTRKND
jgi:hypothetical protein